MSNSIPNRLGCIRQLVAQRIVACPAKLIVFPKISDGNDRYAHRLNYIYKRFLHLPEIDEAGDEDGECDADAHPKARPPGREFVAEHAPAKAVYRADERVQMEEQPPFFRQQCLPQKADGRDIHPDADDEWHDVAHVAVFHIQRAEPHAAGEGGEKCGEEKEREQQQLRAEGDAVKWHQHEEDCRGDERIEHAAEHGADGDDQARKIDFGNDARGGDEGVAAFTESVGEKLPR